MIPRQAAALAANLARAFKVLAIIGPRQSGKTTLACSLFGDKAYVNLEEPDQRTYALEEPRRFLAQFSNGAILDEAQHCPDLFSYLQGLVDADPAPGQFILTGSQHFGLVERITQSLAGRVGFVRLLPFSLGELTNGDVRPASLEGVLYTGGYPPVYDQPVTPEWWYNAYITTYVERDVRQLINVRDLIVFQRFMALCAGHIGQLLNTTRMGADLGVTHNTVRTWLDLLEASFVLFRLRPHYRNFRKRLVKTPKLYFYDTGLAARLLGLESPHQLATHPMRGPLFENWVVADLLKQRGNRGKADNFFFWRNHTGLEVDLLADQGQTLLPVEIKAGSMVAADWFRPLVRWSTLAGEAGLAPWLVYGGDQRQQRQGVEIVPWAGLGELGALI